MTHRVAVLAGDGVGPEVIRGGPQGGRRPGPPDRVDRAALGLRLVPRARDDDAAGRARADLRPRRGAAGRDRRSRRCPTTSRSGGRSSRSGRSSTCGRTCARAGCCDGIPGPLAGRGPGDVDMLFVRENTEGEYAGVGGRAHQGLPSEVALETCVFTRAGVRAGPASRVRARGAAARDPHERDEVERVPLRLRALGRGRRGARRRVPGVRVRARARRRARGADGALDPDSLDVVVASNLFADILTDLAAAIQGGMGMAASANIAPGIEHGRRSSSRCTAPPRTSPGRGSRTRPARSGARR